MFRGVYGLYRLFLQEEDDVSFCKEEDDVPFCKEEDDVPFLMRRMMCLSVFCEDPRFGSSRGADAPNNLWD